MASTPHRKRRRFGKLTFETLEPRVVLDSQLGALLADSSIAPATTEGEQTLASEVAGVESQFVRFSSADELKQFLVDDADKRYADQFGREAWSWWYPIYLNQLDGAGTPLRTDAVVTGDAALESDYSSTNIQVAGVDEGDLIKTDGRCLYIGRGAEVTIVDVQSADKMRILSRLSDLGNTSALYLSDDRLTVISQGYATFTDPMPMIDAAFAYRPWGGESKFQVTVYDVSAPETPALISRLEVEGYYVDSRMIGNTVFLVSSHQFHLPSPEIVPGRPVAEAQNTGETLRLEVPSIEPAVSILPWPGPNPGGSGWVYETREQYWQRIGDQVLDLALPNYSLTDAAGNSIGAGLLSAAEATYRPLGGLDGQLVSVTALDVGAGVPAVVASSSAPIGSASTVYVSPQSLYVVTADWSSAELTSQIYKFSLRAEEGRIPLVAAGRVPGQVLNSFSLDEQDSYLRIVTQRGWRAEAESALYVLDQVGEKLTPVGQLEGLAPAEQLYSVRFMGDRAFVVTFGPDGGWWVDPLFTIDLSNPAEPRVEGELEIPGFSNYLQMIDGQFLLGLGRDADETNGRQLGPQVSLFDVSEFDDPLLADRVSFGEASSWSEAFFNHHAISYFPDQHVLAIPLDTWAPVAVVVDEVSDPVLGNVRDVAVSPLPMWQSQLWVFRIDTTEGEPARIHVLGTITHDSSILRSLRIGEQLFSVSADTIQVHDIFDPGVMLDELYFGPRAQDDWFSVDRNSQEKFLDVLANDRIGDEASGAWTLTEVTLPAHGTVTISEDGRGLLYTPAPGFLGDDSFVYTITGPDGSIDEARVTVYVNAWADQERMTKLALEDLAQRLSVPVEEISVRYAEAVDWPDSCLGVAVPGQACLDVITPGFRISLWHGWTNYVYHTDTRETVILADTIVDYQAMGDWFTVDLDSQDNYLDVLANDRIGSDADGRIISAVTPPARGVVAISDDGRGLLYTPAPGFRGTDSFFYTIRGADGSASEACVTVDVHSLADERRMTELALQDLAQRLAVPVEEISVQSVVVVDWPDSCLSVPVPGQACLQVITPGFRILLRHATTTYAYHTDSRDTVILADTIADGQSREDPLNPLPSDPVVRVRLEVTDANGQAVTTVQAGETFTLNVYVDSLLAGGAGVFAMYADVLYPGRLVSVSDEGITFSSPYVNGRSGQVDGAGLIDELGAFGGIGEPGDTEWLLASVSFVARRAGTASFVLTPADDVGHETLIYGSDRAVPADLVQWEGAEVEVVGGWNNTELPTDVNDDGRTSPLDALYCINAINAHGRQFLDRTQLQSSVAAADRFFFDVDGDDYLTPGDIVTIVNRVNSDADAETAAAPSGDGGLPARPLASWVDWQTLNDLLHEERWQEPLQALHLSPERTLDMVHQLLVTVDADRLDELLRNSTPVDPKAWRTAMTPVLDAIRDHVSVDQLLDLTDQLQANFDDLDLQTVMPGLAPQIDATSASAVFRDQFFTKLSDPLFLLDLLDS